MYLIHFVFFQICIQRNLYFCHFYKSGTRILHTQNPIFNSRLLEISGTLHKIAPFSIFAENLIKFRFWFIVYRIEQRKKGFLKNLKFPPWKFCKQIRFFVGIKSVSSTVADVSFRAKRNKNQGTLVQDERTESQKICPVCCRHKNFACLLARGEKKCCNSGQFLLEIYVVAG